MRAIYLLDRSMYERIYPPQVRTEIERLLGYQPDYVDPALLRDDLSLLRETEIILSGWGGVTMDEQFMENAPRLKAVFYGAGSIKSIVTDAFWNRNILITSSYAANAIPVADFSLSLILMALKGGWHLARRMKDSGGQPWDRAIQGEFPGTCGSTVGIVSLGMIGRTLAERLRPFELDLIAYDPYVAPKDAEKLNVELCSLEELFARADVVSVHTPWLPETERMIKGRHILSMKKWGSFINTARGAVVHEEELIEALRQRPDLQAVLDVTYPEPPEPGSPLYDLPNVVLTPHIAGATSEREIARMGSFAAAELKRYLNGEPALWPITRERVQLMA